MTLRVARALLALYHCLCRPNHQLLQVLQSGFQASLVFEFIFWPRIISVCGAAIPADDLVCCGVQSGRLQNLNPTGQADVTFIEFNSLLKL